jgi:hypothetical protein
VAYCWQPCDIRTAAVAIGEVPSEDACADYLKAFRDNGAPIVLLAVQEHVGVWKQTADKPSLLTTLSNRELDEYFRSNCDAFAPKEIYRAKNLPQTPTETQLEFVDIDLMPFLERHVGDQLSTKFADWIGNALPDWQGALGTNESAGEMLLRSVFRLLAAKILQDKGVPGFKQLNRSDVAGVLQKVVQHCGGAPDTGISRPAANVLETVARQVFGLASLRHMSTESLGVIYENAFISKATRKKLGTHSTPPWLADYMLWQVEDWFRELPAEQRIVYEPACGHGAFLVAALRMLQQFAFEERQPHAETVPYVRRMLHGADIDPFSLEIARLSLSLTDVPNPNGWWLKHCDLFQANPLEREIPVPGLVLTNPPYEAFAPQDREAWHCTQYVKYAEILARTLPHIRENGIVGFVAPRSFLTSPKVAAVRKILASEFEIIEIAHFPDKKVFTLSQAETCVVLAQRRKPHPRSTIRYAYVKDDGVTAFRKRYAFGFEQKIDVVRVARPPLFDLSVPFLANVWDSLADNPRLGDLADIGRGIEFQKGYPGTRGGTPRELLRYVEPNVLHHQEPKPDTLVFADEDVRFWGTAATTGKPQVVVNASGRRDPWKIWALMDPNGFPTTKRLITIRPKSASTPLTIDVLWAILTSPFAQAFVHAKSGKRDIDTRTYEALPLPLLRDLRNCSAVERAVEAYVGKARAADAAQGPAAPRAANELKRLRLQIDAEVLKLYDLAPRDERAILDLFSGHKRPGVPFDQTEYFPQDFVSCIPLHVYLTFIERAPKAARLRRSRVWQSLPDEFKQAVSDAAQPCVDDLP